MEKINYQTVKPILRPKNPTVQDPPRYPELIVPLEDEFKKSFAVGMNKMLADITKKMVKIVKS